MKTATVRLGLSLMVALCLSANKLPAQQVILAPGDVQVFVVPVIPYEPASHPPLPAPFAQPGAPGPAQHRLQNLLNQHGMACQSNARWGSCGNFHYDFHFIFGSCRSFFGERCYPNMHNGYVGNGNGNCQR